MKAFSSLFLTTAFLFSMNARAANRQWVIPETRADGNVRVRIVESDPGRAAVQGPISQDVVFDQIMRPEEFSRFKAERAPRRALVLPQAGQPLWVATKTVWTPADEDAYSAWFASEVSPDFLDGAGLNVDCADTGLLFRWVFARDHRLPIANTLSGSGVLFGHFSGNAAWDKLRTNADWKKDERFKAALRYLFDNTYTRTVVADLAPTLITPQYVRPGSMFMIIRETSGHTQSLLSVSPDAGITTVWGNEPAAEAIYRTSILIEFDEKETFGVWREPRLNAANQWELTPATEMPGYSLEQFQQVFTDQSAYTGWINGRLGIQLSNLERLSTLSSSLYVGLHQRLRVTAEGLFACFYKQCDPSGSDYSSYSTISRDKRLANTQAQIEALVNQLSMNDEDVQDWLSQLSSYPDYIPGTQLTVTNLALNQGIIEKFSPDPRVPYAARWGLQDVSATDPNFDFFISSSIMSQLILDRGDDVRQKLDSTALDAEIGSMFLKIKADRQAAQFNAPSFNEVYNGFSQMHVVVPGTSSCDNSKCSINDLIWGEDGNGDQLSKWSAKASDTPAVRWGFLDSPNQAAFLRR